MLQNRKRGGTTSFLQKYSSFACHILKYSRTTLKFLKDSKRSVITAKIQATKSQFGYAYAETDMTSGIILLGC
jgi:hypothetical protein